MFLSNLIPVDQAQKIIHERIKTTVPEKKSLDDAFQRILSEDILSKFDSPPFKRSAMDGYALKAENTFGLSENNPGVFQIIDRIGAGKLSNKNVNINQAVQIATGAPIPAGADAVVMEEYTRSNGEELRVEMSVVPGENVSLAGEDIKKYQKVLKSGNILYPPELGIIASAGYMEVEVYKKPSVGVMITGSELVMPKDELQGAEVINSNHFTIKSLVESSLGVPEMSHSIDNKTTVRTELLRLIENNDAVITTGGTAISKGDVVVDVAEDLGEVPIHGVALRPGKPFAFAVINQKPVFMLSGYPVAAMVQYDVFVRENLLKMQGLSRDLSFLEKKAKRKTPSPLGRTDYIRAKIEGDYISPLKSSGSGIIRSMVESDSYIVIEENKEGLAKDEKCKVLTYDSLKI
jgi:molybdopterin molybdotransferase